LALDGRQVRRRGDAGDAEGGARLGRVGRAVLGIGHGWAPVRTSWRYGWRSRRSCCCPARTTPRPGGRGNRGTTPLADVVRADVRRSFTAVTGLPVRFY